jgi:hypothetical protein
MELERAAGREPIDRRAVAAFPAEIESPPRIIEVKAAGGNARKTGFLWLEVIQVERGRADPNFHLYVVDNISQGDPSKFRLKVLNGQRLARLLARAREKRYYEMPLPAADFDAAPGVEGLGMARSET